MILVPNTAVYFLQGCDIIRRSRSSTKDLPSWSEPFRQSFPPRGPWRPCHKVNPRAASCSSLHGFSK